MKYHWERKRRSVNHADDWLMTYADMITLLLCFFAILLSLSLAKKFNAPQGSGQTALTVQAETVVVSPDQKEEAARVELVEHEAAQPESANKAQPGGLYEVQFPPVEWKSVEDTADTVLTSEPMDSVEPQPLAPQDVVTTRAELAAAKPQEAAPSSPEKKAPPSEEKGDRLTVVEMNSAAFFDSGSATLREGGKSALRVVAIRIKGEEYKDYQITVEGHTDDSPINTPYFHSNWELSTARASAVVHFFLEQGLPAQRLRAAGYADTFPKAPNRDSAGNPLPANQAQNRRVVIKLERVDRLL